MTATDTGPKILVTGATGNLGLLLTRHLAAARHRVRAMVHSTPLPADLQALDNVEEARADLADPATLPAAVAGVDVVVHFAGVLFAPGPEKFLPETNTRWFSNLIDACLAARVERVILISFPHVEGPTSVDDPAQGRLDRQPISVHAQTRLEEERLLIERCRDRDTTPVSLRLGMVYGAGILMIDGARFAATHGLLGVWREPTWIHLISTADYLSATVAAILRPGIAGIYHVGDEQPVTLQHFLDEACEVWGVPGPVRMPVWLIYAAASVCETVGRILGRASPLTRDFISIGRVSYYGDTTRMRAELLADLRYPTLESGLDTLRHAPRE
jgi:nucleoside-diphosphate-sugar epimerase